MSAVTAAASSGFGGPVGFGEVALALLLVAVALAVSRWRQVGLENDLTVATVRSFVQLLAVGYALDFVFRGRGGLTLVVLAVMVGTATLTSAGRAAGVPGARPIAAASITVADNVGGDTPALLARVGLNPGLATREADRLSVGEAQRMCLARSLALGPEVLALDEPTSALDTASKAGIEELIVGLARSGLTVVMVTHDPRHTDLADHVVTVEPLSREDGR